MLGPDMRGHLSRALLKVSREVLSSGGTLLIVSDPVTVAAARFECDEQSVDYRSIDQGDPFVTLVPDTLVIPQS